MDSPFVPGYLLEQRLGVGSHGSVWVAREESSGEIVAVKLLAIPSFEQRAEAQQEALALTTVDHPHLVPIYGVIEIEDGLAVVMALADGGNLADLLGARQVLDPGEVVTICAPLADALSEIHRRGVVHGEVQPANILFTADGRPMLSDLGVARLTGQFPALVPGVTAPEVEAGKWPVPASDVYGMAATAVLALTGYLPGKPLTLPGIAPATHGALARALHPDPDRRLDAASLSNAMFALADPEPVGLVANTGELSEVGMTDEADAEETDPGRRGGRRARGRGRPELEPAVEPRPPADKERRRPRSRKDFLLVGLALLVALPVVGLGAYGVWNQLRGEDVSMLPGAGRVTSPGSTEEAVDLCGGLQPAPTEAPPEVTDWTPVVEGMFELRATAFTELDPERLCQLFAPTSPHLAADYELIQDYQDAGVRPRGLQFEVVDVEVISEAGELPVVLEITDRITPYDLVDEDGEVVEQLEGVPEGTWRAELVVAADASGYRFS
ncbi:MAG TPA: serine/threonine-protein kinase [Jiangellaceae bacterium]|nr:serine/threonine-protein kinase [Jiangellaceae bacterium]